MDMLYIEIGIALSQFANLRSDRDLFACSVDRTRLTALLHSISEIFRASFFLSYSRQDLADGDVIAAIGIEEDNWKPPNVWDGAEFHHEGCVASPLEPVEAARGAR
jgi:hypothetical protein